MHIPFFSLADYIKYRYRLYSAEILCKIISFAAHLEGAAL